MSYFAWLPALGLDCPSKLAGHVVVGPGDSRGERGQAGLYALLGLKGTGRKSDFVLFRLAGSPWDSTAPQLAGWTRQPGTVSRQGPARPGTQRGTGRKVDLVSRGSQQESHHRDETEMAFPREDATALAAFRAPAGERARPTLALSKGHRAEMELWRNKKALDLRGHRTTPHRSGERRGYRSETESP